MLTRVHDASAISLPLVRQIDRFTQPDRNVFTCHIVARTAAIGLTFTFALDASWHLIAGVVRMPVAVVLLAWDRTRCRAMTHDIGCHLSLTIRYLALAVFGAAPVAAIPWKATAVVEWVGQLSLTPQEKSFAVRMAAACTQAWKSPYVRAVAGMAAVAALGAAAWHFAPVVTIKEESPSPPPPPPPPSPSQPPPPPPSIDPSIEPPVPAFGFPIPSYQLVGGVAMTALALGGAYYARPKVIALATRARQLVRGVTIDKFKELATREMIFGFPPALLAGFALGFPTVLLTHSRFKGIAVTFGGFVFAEKKIGQWRGEAIGARLKR